MATLEYGDLLKAGIIDPTKVVKTSLQSCLLYTSAFLRGMMRNFAGALVAVGTGLTSAAELARALVEPVGFHPGWEMAPAHGLHQWQVEYRAPAAEVQA